MAGLHVVSHRPSHRAVGWCVLRCMHADGGANQEHSNSERGYLPHLGKKLRAAFEKAKPGSTLEVFVSQVDKDPLSVV